MDCMDTTLRLTGLHILVPHGRGCTGCYHGLYVESYPNGHMEMLKAPQAESTSSSFIFLRNLCSSS